MNKKIGFIGLGKMAAAIIAGILNSNFCESSDITATEINEGTKKQAGETFRIEFSETNKELAEKSDIIMLCVKPYLIKNILEEIKPVLNQNKTIISIAAGISVETIEKYAGEAIPVIRVMSNTPALVKEGMSAVAKGNFADEKTQDYVTDLFSKIGKSIKVNEKDIDIITALSGSGPAFYYRIIDEMAKSAQKLGLDYDTAILLSSQTALGAAKMILNTQDTISSLINAVTTPGGCTETGNKVLSNSDLSEILSKTIESTAQKAAELGKN